MSGLRLNRVAKTFPGGQVAVAGVDLEVAPRELVVLLGPSGCGKSTLLRMIAGIETPTSGSIWIGDQDVTAEPPQRRDVAMVFQNYALYPHMTVAENIAFGLRMRGQSGETVAARVREVAASLDLQALLERRPGQLSGGQRQRVALGRAIARKAKVFLLDEPLSNLDVQLRVTTRMELARLHRKVEAPMVYVTHDQEEAMTLGTRVVVMRAGHVLQVGTPMEIYTRPATAFVGGFVGSPRMNLLPARAEGKSLAFERTQVILASGVSIPARDVTLGVRPEDITLVAPEESELRAQIDLVEPLGREQLVHVLLSETRTALRVLAPGTASIAVGSERGLRLRPEALHLFDPTTEIRLN
ncbi:MAG: sn-glycerol-3-phosphate ABC transporter ATP-binding protein UgpC [Candidatus Eisenbacteria bacterium]|nr:sn-glycerol-3-phosphate ABC transporter ATP-binding protein UgpC [Candidatus Eisenbacteria bacterium]